MKIFLLTLLVYGLAMAGLAVGRLFGRGLRGACGSCEGCPSKQPDEKARPHPGPRRCSDRPFPDANA